MTTVVEIISFLAFFNSLVVAVIHFKLVLFLTFSFIILFIFISLKEYPPYSETRELQ